MPDQDTIEVMKLKLRLMKGRRRELAQRIILLQRRIARAVEAEEKAKRVRRKRLAEAFRAGINGRAAE